MSSRTLLSLSCCTLLSLSALATFTQARSQKQVKNEKGDVKSAGDITDRPLTVEVSLDASTRSEIERALLQDRGATVRLYINGIKPPARRDLAGGIKVFLNKANASAETPTDDPHFVTAFDLAPTTSDKEQDFSFDLRPTLATLDGREKLDLSKPLKITLAALPMDETSCLSKDFLMHVDKVAVVAKPKASN